MDTSTLTQKGQIVVPSKIRKALGLNQGDKVAFLLQDGKLLLKPVGKNYFDSLRGILKTKGKVLKALLREKKRERSL